MVSRPMPWPTRWNSPSFRSMPPSNRIMATPRPISSVSSSCGAELDDAGHRLQHQAAGDQHHDAGQADLPGHPLAGQPGGEDNQEKGGSVHGERGLGSRWRCRSGVPDCWSPGVAGQGFGSRGSTRPWQMSRPNGRCYPTRGGCGVGNGERWVCRLSGSVPWCQVPCQLQRAAGAGRMRRAPGAPREPERRAGGAAWCKPGGRQAWPGAAGGHADRRSADQARRRRAQPAMPSSPPAISR